MRTLSGAAGAVMLSVGLRAILAGAFGAGLLLASAGGSAAQNYGNGSNPYYLNNQTYSSGLYLPQVPQPNGQDEIRAADGTTCRSSMASNNAYLDMGGIGGQGQDGSFESGTVYGRLIVPLGGVPDRLDCSALYNLEIERLKNELALARSGATAGAFVPSSAGGAAGAKDKAWAEKGWSDGASTSGAKSTSAAQQAAVHRVPAATVVPMRLQPIGAVSARLAEPQGEILPWSHELAQPARVLMGVPSKAAYQPVFSQDAAAGVTMQQLAR